MQHFSFGRVCLLTSFLFLSLSAVLVLFPEIVYRLFALQQNDLGDFLAKRAGVLFLGYFMLCFLSRNSVIPEVRDLVSIVVGSTMGLMAVVGLYELARSNVGAGILLAILVELIVGVMFFRIGYRGRE